MPKFLEWAGGVRSSGTVRLYRDNLRTLLREFTGQRLHEITREIKKWPHQRPLQTLSGRSESNRHAKLGKLICCHYITPAKKGTTHTQSESNRHVKRAECNAMNMPKGMFSALRPYMLPLHTPAWCFLIVTRELLSNS